MRNYVLTDAERKILREWLESGEESPGYPILKNRILRNFGAILEDVKLIAEYSMRIESTLSPQSQGEALEIQRWLLNYLTRAAPRLTLEVGEISMRYDVQSALLGAAFANAPDAHVIVGGDGATIYANDAFSRLVEKPRDELVGVYNLFGASDELAALLRSVDVGKKLSDTLYVEGLGSTPKWIEVNACSFSAGDIDARIVSLRDVTERKAVEKRLKGLIDKL